MVSRHIEVHGGEAAEPGGPRSAGPVPDLRREIADEDVQASLGHVGTLPRDGDGDPGETTTIVGERATTAGPSSDSTPAAAWARSTSPATRS